MFFQNLVHSLAGEYLNSADANDRIIACKLFPLLKSRPNKVKKRRKKKREVLLINFLIGYNTKIDSSYVARYE